MSQTYHSTVRSYISFLEIYLKNEEDNILNIPLESLLDELSQNFIRFQSCKLCNPEDGCDNCKYYGYPCINCENYCQKNNV